MTGHADPVRREPHDVRETTAATRPRVAPAAHGSELQRGLKPQEILALQRTAGNAAVGHLLRRQTPTAAGRPPLRRPASASVHRQSMDAGVVTRPSHPAVPAPPEPSRVSCPVSAVNWLDHAERTAARLAETSSAVAPLEHMRLPPAPTYLSESDGDPSLLAAWGALAQVVEQVSATWVEAAPLVSEYLAAANNESIPGGAGVTLSQVSRPDGAAVAPSPDARRALFGDADFEGAAHQMYAAQDTIERHVQEAHAAAIDLTAAERAIEHAVAEQRLHGAHDEQADAQGRRAAAQEGRANELQNIQNAIRVLELGVGLLAGGVAARAAGSGATGPASVRQAAGTATTAAVAGIGSNSLHDLAVGFVAERFVSERWSQQIEEASRTIARPRAAALDRPPIRLAGGPRRRRSATMEATETVVGCAQDPQRTERYP